MANEIKKDEIMNDAELDQVAGGNVSNTASDSQFLRDIEIEGIKGWGKSATESRFNEISGYVKEAWGKIGIEFNGVKDGNNVYKLDGKEISRFDAYLYAQRKQDKKVNMANYDF